MRSALVKDASALALIMAAPTVGYPAADAAKVYFLLPNSTTIRFTTRDAPLYVAALKKLTPNAQVIVQNGEGDQARQQRLVEDAVSQGAKVIVLTASDSNLAAGRP
jgi:D-xylose transport system substrate-binding protein